MLRRHWRQERSSVSDNRVHKLAYPTGGAAIDSADLAKALQLRQRSATA
jgi:hypothetical protein